MVDTPHRDKNLVRRLAAALKDAAAGLPSMKMMHVCGTHEHEVGRHALRQLLPENVELVAGPGCPVCITPAKAIATGMALALHASRPIFCAYGDVVRVPIDTGHLLATRGQGAEIRLIYGPRDAVRLACANPNRPVVFFSIGFETTAAAVAAMLLGEAPRNLFLYCTHRYVPTAVEGLAGMLDSDISGYLLPGHASVITGSSAYTFLPERYHVAAAVAGFEPVDILVGILSLVRQIRMGHVEVANCYPRVVREEGNLLAQKAIHTVFTLGDGAWRGIGVFPNSALVLRKTYQAYDALLHFGIPEVPAEDVMPGCLCHLIMIGRRKPFDCAFFRNACTPNHPRGPCMVGSEGTCRSHFLYSEGYDV